ncbi:MAG: MATE family efflux transporter [Caulobacteraceae bacterium]|nr:MATE family efflux transporter [Caulobacteraceae bacterium]
MLQPSPSSPPAPKPPAQRHNLVEGPIGKTLFLFALPVLGGNALQNLNGTVNAFWVSHSLGVEAVTAISNANIIMQLLLGTVFGISMAANIMIGQAYGARDMHTVKRVVGTATSFFVVLPVLVAIFGMIATPHILDAMRTPLDARADAIAYLRVIFAAMPFMYFFAYMQMAQRGGGDSTTPFYFMIVAVLLDSTLNPMLIRGLGPFPRMGIAGAATATLIGQGVSLLLLIVFLYRRQSHLMLRRHELRLLWPQGDILKALVLKGLPMGVQMIVLSVAAMMMISLVNHYGSMTTAAYGAASQVWTYVQMPAMAVSAAVSSMAAQNVGAQRWDRIGQIAGKGVGICLAVTGLVVLVIYGLGDTVLGLFLPPHSAALPIARHIDFVVLWAFVLFSVTFTLFGIVRSTGAVWAPLGVLVVSMWLIRVPFAMLLRPHFGAEAIWWSFPLGTITSAALAALYYLYGGWRALRFSGPVRVVAAEQTESAGA